MKVMVGYATSATQNVIELEVNGPISAQQAIAQSGILGLHPELDIDKLTLGIYGKKCAPSTLLAANDRVEIYRPLLLTPTEARRLRAATSAKEKNRQ